MLTVKYYYFSCKVYKNQSQEFREAHTNPAVLTDEIEINVGYNYQNFAGRTDIVDANQTGNGK